MSTLSSFDPIQVIRKRRYGPGEHSDEELQWWIESYTNGSVPDYQMAAWLMATCFRPLSRNETAQLTHCMVQSTPGGPLQWNKGTNPPTMAALVDKHSTGGVGDKVSLILSPLVASLGVGVPMISGRGLGHTGGTIDKLESIPGFDTQLSTADFQRLVAERGAAMAQAGPELCPADRQLYALRDCTSTVESIGLQTASIMCKKIAEHPDSLILDCKYGNGSFQSTAAAAGELAVNMVQTGHANGLEPTVGFLTQMSQPLGTAIGNWLEVQECLEIMELYKTRKPKETNGTVDDNAPIDISPTTHVTDARLNYDLICLTCLQAGQMLLQSKLPQYQDQTLSELTQLAYDHLTQKPDTLNMFWDMGKAQGAKGDSIQDWYPPAAEIYQGVDIVAPTTGRLIEISTTQLGLLANVSLGAGRKQVHESVDPYAGMLLRCKLGHQVQEGQPMLTLYAPEEKITSAVMEQVARCFTIQQNDNEAAAPLKPVVTHVVTLEDGVQEMSWEELAPCFHKLYPNEVYHHRRSE